MGGNVGIDKQLSYSRGTARHAVSVETVRNVTKISADFDKSHNGRMTFKVIQGHWKWHALGHMILSISSVQQQRVYIASYFFDTTTFTVYVTACRGPNLEKSFIIGKQLRLKTKYTFLHMQLTLVIFIDEQELQQQPFNGLFSRTTWVSRYQKGKTNLDFTGARDSEWQWHHLGHMQVCTSLQTDNHTSTPPLCFFYRPDALPAAQPTASKH